MSSPLTQAGLKHLQLADSYFCFARIWWDGSGLDSVCWWKDSTGCRQRVLMTGETCTAKEPITISDHPIPETIFSKLLDEAISLKIEQLPSQSIKIALTHFDDWYGIKRGNDDVGNWLQIAGGVHKDSGEDLLLDWIYRQCPALLPMVEE